MQVVGEPLFGGDEVVTFQNPRLLKQARRAGDLDQVNRVDDPVVSTSLFSLDRLRVLEVWIHARLLVDKPRVKMLQRRQRVFAVVGDSIRAGEGGDMNTEADQRPAMLDKVVGIGQSILLDIRPIGIGRVGPEVIRLREEIMLAAGTARTMRRRHGDRLVVEHFVRSDQSRSRSIRRMSKSICLAELLMPLLHETHEKQRINKPTSRR